MDTRIATNNKRIAKNTIFLYFRMILLMLINLYTSRVILNVLGISDYGLYNVVGGLVLVFAFLNGTLSTSTQRFLNIEIGKDNFTGAKLVFSTAMILHILLALIIVIAAESVGLWFVTNKLNIPDERFTAALFVYQFSIISICIQVLQLPFMSSLIAHEDMKVYAYVSMYEAVARLGIVFVLSMPKFDKLILYAALYLLVQLSVAVFYIILARKKHIETRFSFNIINPDIFKKMLNFSGWNVVGCFASAANNQGINIILNIFFGTSINAARAIAYQVNGIVYQFVSNFLLASKPQIINYYASGNNSEMIRLCLATAKTSGFLILIIIVPLFVELENILTIWLVNYPTCTPIFLRLVLFQSLLIAMASNLITVVHATGKLKEVGLMAGGLQLLVLPISFFLLKFGLPAETPYYIAILGSIGETYVELYWMNHYVKYPIWEFYKNVYIPVLGIFSVSLTLSYLFSFFILDCFVIIRIILLSIFSICVSISLIWRFGLDYSMRSKISKMILLRIKKL